MHCPFNCTQMYATTYAQWVKQKQKLHIYIAIRIYHTCTEFGIRKKSESLITPMSTKLNAGIILYWYLVKYTGTLLTILQIDDIMVIYGYKLILVVHTVCI